MCIRDRFNIIAKRLDKDLTIGFAEGSNFIEDLVIAHLGPLDSHKSTIIDGTIVNLATATRAREAVLREVIVQQNIIAQVNDGED